MKKTSKTSMFKKVTIFEHKNKNKIIDSDFSLLLLSDLRTSTSILVNILRKIFPSISCVVQVTHIPTRFQLKVLIN